jgi:hypothetical protein
MLLILTSLKSLDLPREIAGQNAKAVEVISELVKRVLGREEKFSLTVRRSTQRCYLKDTSTLLLPPVEVLYDNYLGDWF